MTVTLPLKFLITNFLEGPVLLEATAEVLAIPLVLCSVIAEKLALLSCRVSSAIIRLALWLNAVWFKCFAKLVLDCSAACLFTVGSTESLLNQLSLVDSRDSRNVIETDLQTNTDQSSVN